AGQADFGVDRDVVALIRARRRTLIAAPRPRGRVRAASPTLAARRRGSRRRLAVALILRRALGVGRRHRQTLDDAGRADDRCALRSTERDLDHFQPEAPGIWIVD